MTSASESPFIEVGERLGHPVLTWAPRWWPLLDKFKGRRIGTFEEDYEVFEPNWHGYPPHLRYKLALLPRSQRDELVELARAMHDFVLPDGGLVYLTGMTALSGKRTQALIAALSETLRNVYDERAALCVPLVRSGGPNGLLDFHADLWYQRILLSIYERPSANEGGSYLISLERFLDVASAYIAEEALAEVSAVLHRNTWSPTHLVELFPALWGQEFSTQLRDATEAAATKVHFAPGEGYVLDDGVFLHARGYLSLDEASESRLHRLSYDNVTTETLRVEPSPASAGPVTSNAEFEHDIPARWQWFGRTLGRH